MTNEEKAKTLYRKYRETDLARESAAFNAAMEMAEWKDRQIIEKVCEWLQDMSCYYAHWEYNGDTYEKEVVYDTEKLIKDFRKAMDEK